MTVWVNFCFETGESQFFTLHTRLSDSEFEKAKKVVASEIESEFDKQTIFQNNHPGLNSTQFFEVLEGAKIFIGLGFPFEGPSPIEALQAGCYFINPIWEPPIGRSLDGENSKEYIRGFFSNKPTVRQLESQVPYLATINRNRVKTIPRINKNKRRIVPCAAPSFSHLFPWGKNSTPRKEAQR